MAEELTIARPYAEAAFAVARDERAIPQWEDMLDTAAAVASDPRMLQMLTEPMVSWDTVEQVFFGVTDASLTETARNLMRVLADNRRLTLLPAIATLFHELAQADANTATARIVTAFPLSAGQLERLQARLAKRYGKTIEAEVDLNPDLIGGVTVTVGDEMIDASVRGRLESLATALKR